MVRLFEQKLYAEDNFKKNKIECAFATAENKYTLGFCSFWSSEIFLLKGNKLETTKAKRGRFDF